MKSNIEKVLKDNGYLIYSFSGTSMHPLLKENNKVRLETGDNYNLFDVVLFKRRKNTYVLHRIIDIKNEKYIVIGDNASYIDYLNKEDLLAKLTGIYKNEKLIKLLDIDNKGPYENIAIKNELLKDKEIFFLRRKQESYYELIKLATLGAYDENKIIRLTNRELIELCQYLEQKKGFHLLGFAIEKFGLNLDDKKKSKAMLYLIINQQS